MDIWRGRLRAFSHTVWARTLVFSLCTLVVLVFAGAAVSRWSQNALSDQIEALNAAQISAGLKQLESEIEKLETMESKLLFDTDINRLGVMPGYYAGAQSAFAMLRASERMQLLADSSALVSHAYFLAPAIGKSITETGVDTLSSAFFAEASEKCVSRGRSLIQIGGEYYLLFAYPTYATYLRENGAMYILCAQIDRAAIGAMLKGLTADTDECVMLFEAGELVALINGGAFLPVADALFARAADGGAFTVRGEDGEKYIAVASASQKRDITLIKLSPQKRIFTSINTQRALFFLLLTLAAAANLLYALRLWQSIHKPLRVLSDAFEQMEKGVLSTRIHHKREDEFAGIYQRFNHMNEQLENLIEQAYKQTIRTQRAELKQLQSQINPHFLYNSFFMMKAFARMGDCQSVEQLTDELGEYFRYITRNGEEDAPLQMEVTHARNYTAIQDMRFSSRIQLQFEALPEAIRDVRVPRLILQPLIENAYSHGLSESKEKGVLRVWFWYDDAYIKITVEDSGGALTDDMLLSLIARLDDGEVAETTGIINIHRRLRLRFGAGFGLALFRSELGGLKVIMTLPRGGIRA